MMMKEGTTADHETTQGLFMICAWCKTILRDALDRTLVSHGICPRCVAIELSKLLK
jgi:hypothetical protein